MKTFLLRPSAMREAKKALSVLFLLTLIITIPVTTLSVLQSRNLGLERKAAEGENLEGSSLEKNPVSWETDYVSLTADDFYILADGEEYLDNVSDINIHSDPGNATRTTLELTWEEKGQEMRMNMYFSADASDWWVSEIRTYGDPGSGSWIYYTGPLFRTPLGSAYTGDIDLTADEGNAVSGAIHFENLYLQPFFGGSSLEEGVYIKSSMQGKASGDWDGPALFTIEGVVSETPIALDSQGEAYFDLSNYPINEGQPYNFYLKGYQHLRKKVTLTYTPGMTVDFGEMFTGDVYLPNEQGSQDGEINSLDFTKIVEHLWSTVKDYYDLDGNGEINSLDFTLMFPNWFKVDDPYF